MALNGKVIKMDVKKKWSHTKINLLFINLPGHTKDNQEDCC
jgi:hypothetical protein